MISTEYIESDPPIYRSYYPPMGLRQTLEEIVADFGWNCPFAHLKRDIVKVMRAAREHLGGKWATPDVNYQIQVLYSGFTAINPPTSWAGDQR